MTKQEQQILEYALSKVEALIAAGNGDKSRCGCFTSPFDGVSPEDQAKVGKHVSLYVGSWIEPALRILAKRARGEQLTYDEQESIQYMD